MTTAKKILSWKKALLFRKKAGLSRKTIVFTNGCFDIIHAGHVSLLESAKSMGDILMVALNSDASVKRIKGAGRPLVSQADRAKVLAAMESVDAVVIFGQDTPFELLRAIKPDILVKGSDYGKSEVIGREFSGRLARVELTPGKSTTEIIKKLKRNLKPFTPI